jgi:HD-GYP domain-containing protein (c-di-GMP phosphodiesterase class II)
MGCVARIVRHEHERFDGTGYPDGLAGEEIPLGSRIILACDAYHAMTSDRPYRAGLGHTHAVAELVRCAGSQFDPRIVAALVSHLGRSDDQPRFTAGR